MGVLVGVMVGVEVLVGVMVGVWVGAPQVRFNETESITKLVRFVSSVSPSNWICISWLAKLLNPRNCMDIGDQSIGVVLSAILISVQMGVPLGSRNRTTRVSYAELSVSAVVTFR